VASEAATPVRCPPLPSCLRTDGALAAHYGTLNAKKCGGHWRQRGGSLPEHPRYYDPSFNRSRGCRNHLNSRLGAPEKTSEASNRATAVRAAEAGPDDPTQRCE